ncbi:NIPSNAP family protein [Cognatiluteimonas profundi]|uniref:NIPSNAP family protein n=1 Tax=Cognatiluteimonas profundi TaxID=2594501 RepID=UPI00131C6E12|nr:NIPSNAP family protein [Lysobacter profundi]
MPDIADTQASPCSVLELRQYTLRPGQRDVLIELFEREFIESQEAVGMTLFGQFRDLDAPDRFVWLRGFTDMPARAAALSAFYGGPAWQAHRDAANATMLDSDNVLLLRPVHPDSGFRPGARPASGQSTTQLVVATLCHFAAPVDAAAIALLDDAITALLVDAGATILATLVSEPAPNNFPRLPVREGEHVLAWFMAFDTIQAYLQHCDALAGSPAWRSAASELQRLTMRSETLRLAPTARSRRLHPRDA